LIVEPSQTGELLAAVGVAGVGFTTTATVPAALVHPPTVTVTLYVPAMAAVADGRVGFWTDEVKEGPVQLYVAPATVGVPRVIVLPAHTGLDAVAVGVAGTGFTVMVIPLLVAVAGLAQEELDVRMQVTVWPVVNAVLVNVALLVPTFAPFTCHW
jgi:hypothetical protein